MNGNAWSATLLKLPSKSDISSNGGFETVLLLPASVCFSSLLYYTRFLEFGEWYERGDANAKTHVFPESAKAMQILSEIYDFIKSQNREAPGTVMPVVAKQYVANKRTSTNNNAFFFPLFWLVVLDMVMLLTKRSHLINIGLFGSGLVHFESPVMRSATAFEHR